jgi:hypothetical protein
VAACPGKVCTTAYQISAARPNPTLFSVLRRGRRYDWMVIDEVSQVPVETWSYLSALRYMGTKFLLVGDFYQLPSVCDRFADALPRGGMENTRVLMDIANHLKISFRTNHRCKDHPEHFEYLLSLRGDVPYQPAYDRFPADLSVLPDLAIVQCHQTRLRMNALMNQQRGVFFKKPERWSPPEPQDMWVYPGLPVIGTRRRNGLWYEVQDATEDLVTLTDGTALAPEVFVREFRLGLAITCHCVQGLTIRGKRVWMLDAHFPHTTLQHYIVAASRCEDPRLFSILTPAQQLTTTCSRAS